jgi:hypothetical protein
MFHYLVALGLLLSSHQIMSNDNICKTVVSGGIEHDDADTSFESLASTVNFMPEIYVRQLNKRH